MTRITAEKINPAANYLAELLNELNLACAHQGITLKIHTSPWNTGDEHRRFEVSLILEYEPEVVFASKVDEPHKPNT